MFDISVTNCQKLAYSFEYLNLQPIPVFKKERNPNGSIKYLHNLLLLHLIIRVTNAFVSLSTQPKVESIGIFGAYGIQNKTISFEIFLNLYYIIRTFFSTSLQHLNQFCTQNQINQITPMLVYLKLF